MTETEIPKTDPGAEDSEAAAVAEGFASADNDNVGAQPEAADPRQIEIDAWKAETATLKDRLLRAMAEMDNLRKRTEREKAEASKYAVTAFARDLLAVADGLERALAALSGEARGHADDAMANLISGVEVTARELNNVLQRHGVVRFDPTGERFDPHKHQAMFQVPREDAPEGSVVQVMQPGYSIGERVLRPALVAVAKGGPPPEAPADADTVPADG